MSLVGATRKHGVDSSTKRYNTVPEHISNSRKERAASRQVVMMMRACNGFPWTPAVERAIDCDDAEGLKALLAMPALEQLKIK